MRSATGAAANFSVRERLALEYAEVINRTGQRVSEDLIARLREYVNEDTLIAFQNLSSKFNSALEIPLQGFCLARR